MGNGGLDGAKLPNGPQALDDADAGDFGRKVTPRQDGDVHKGGQGGQTHALQHGGQHHFLGRLFGKAEDDPGRPKGQRVIVLGHAVVHRAGGHQVGHQPLRVVGRAGHGAVGGHQGPCGRHEVRRGHGGPQAQAGHLV